MLLNRDRALGLMADFGIDALLGATPVNLAYVSDVRPWHHWVYRLFTRQRFQFQYYALFPKDQGTAPALIAPSRGGNLAYMAQWPSWIEDLYLYGPPWNPGLLPPEEAPAEVKRLYQMGLLAQEQSIRTAGEALVRALKDRGLTRGVIGADIEGMNPTQLEYVKRELPDLQWKDAGELFRFIRAVKTAEEISLLRKAAQINWAGFEALLKVAVPGANEEDLSRAFRAGSTLAGGDPVFCNNACGPWASGHWEPRSYNILKPGDIVFCDAGSTYQRYHADAAVCAVLGEPSQTHRQIYEAMVEGLEAAKAAIRPGLKISQVMVPFEQATLRSGAMKSFGGFGHALGLEPRDLPMIQTPWPTAKDDFVEMSHDLVLEAGMVFNLENNIRRAGLGAVAVETTLLVTATGCEVLSPQELKIISLPV